MSRIHKIRGSGGRLPKALFLFGLLVASVAWVYFKILLQPLNEKPADVHYTKEQERAAERALDRFLIERAERRLPSNMSEYYSGIEINDNSAHYSKPSVAGHIEKSGHVCLRSGALAYEPDILRHEAMHGWWQTLSENSQREWASISGAYATSYGATDSQENACEWGRMLQRMARGEKSTLDAFVAEFRNPTSPYFRRLAFLYKKSGITAEEYCAALRH